MDWDEYNKFAKVIADWGTQYHKTIREKPVRAQTKPGEIAQKIAKTPPEEGEPIEAIFADFETKIMPGITHWQHPRFFCIFSGKYLAAICPGRNDC